MSPDEIIDAVQALDPLCDLPRTGWVLRGVASPESLAAHSYGVAMVSMFLCDHLRKDGHEIDGERVLRMALLHDVAEAKTGDVPMPQKTPEMKRALSDLEDAIVNQMLPPPYPETWRALERDDLEARIVHAADKIQMMIKLLTYEQQGRGALREFWENPRNVRTAGIPFAKEIYAAIFKRAGRSSQTSGGVT